MNLRHIKRLLQEQNDVLCLTYERVKLGFPHSSVGKESSCKAGDLGLIPGSGRSSGEGNGNLLQYSCLENPVDRGAWQATVHGVARIGHDLVTKPPPMVYTRLLRRHSGKESSCQCKRGKRCRFYPWVGKIPWSRCLAESFHFCLRFKGIVNKIRPFILYK